MNYTDFLSSFLIAVTYNIFIHQMISTGFQSYSYEHRMEYGMTVIFMAGIVGVVLAKVLLKKNEKLSDSIISMGFMIGGILLLLTAVMVNWDNISDDIRLFITGLLFCGVVYYFYKKKN